MVKFLRILEQLDYMRMVAGICIMVNGYPLIFFFRDALKLAPGSTTFTAVGLAAGLVLMIPLTLFRRLYRPNETMFWMILGYVVVCILYMYIYNPYPQVTDYGRDMIYYAYTLVFLILLVSIPNRIIPVFVPVVILFTLVSNMGLAYALIVDPRWTVGQRASILLGDGDEASGNPHVFSRNAYMGLIACLIWLLRPQTGLLFRLFALGAGVFSAGLLFLTQSRSALLATAIAGLLFITFNVRPAQIRLAARGLLRPVPLLLIAVTVGGFMVLLHRFYDIYGIFYGYFIHFTDQSLDNIYALLGLKAKGTNYQATFDASSVNRVYGAVFLRNILVGHQIMLIPGYGYKYLYLDIPVIEALTNQGILGFALFGGINGIIIYHMIRIMRTNPNPMSTFLAYFYVLIVVQILTNGRPYDMSFLVPICLMARFMGIEHLFPTQFSAIRTDNRPPLSYAPAA